MTRNGEGQAAAVLHEGDGGDAVGGRRQTRDGEGEGEAAAIESARAGRQARVYPLGECVRVHVCVGAVRDCGRRSIITVLTFHL